MALLLALVMCQPASAAIYKVPKKIRSNCSVAVDRQITSWLASVPDGNTAQFAAGGCYGQDGTITLSGRKDLVIDGQNSTFRALTTGDSHRANWRFVNGERLTVQNMTVRGSDPTGEYRAGFEWQHGYSVEGVQGMTLSKVTASDTWGDGVDIWHGAASPACGDDASSARDVLISDAVLERNGRQGVAIVDGERVTVQGSTIGPVAWSSVDIETDDDCEIARHINLVGNSFGANRYGVIANVGFGGDPQVGDVTVTDNVQMAGTGAAGECWAPVRLLSPDTLYRSGYVFRRNQLIGRRNGFELRRINDAEISSNTVALPPTTGCGKRAGVLLVDSDYVSILSNVFSGANYVYTADALSYPISASGNTTG